MKISDEVDVHAFHLIFNLPAATSEARDPFNMEKESFSEFLIDEELHIHTTGRIERYADDDRSPYEPTTYAVLERLADSGYITDTDCLIDYGCGKGRVPIYLSDRTGCRSIGIEIEKDLYDAATSNLKEYNSQKYDDPEYKSGLITLINERAERYRVPIYATCAFFFNPFSVKIFRKVLERLQESIISSPRNMILFLYYPSNSYITHLSLMENTEILGEIDCRDIFQNQDVRNRIMVYKI